VLGFQVDHFREMVDDDLQSDASQMPFDEVLRERDC
jgi:hypothetical protein